MSEPLNIASCGEISPEVFVESVYNVPPLAEQITTFDAVS
jgi:hypothetical protein